MRTPRASQSPGLQSLTVHQSPVCLSEVAVGGLRKTRGTGREEASVLAPLAVRSLSLHWTKEHVLYRAGENRYLLLLFHLVAAGVLTGPLVLQKLLKVEE